MHTVISALGLSMLLFQSAGQPKKTDREFDELNGPARFVRVEAEYILDQSATPKTDGRSLEKIVAYDLGGRVIEEVRGFGKGCFSTRHVFRYDAEGARTEAIYSGKRSAGDKSDSSQTPAPLMIRKKVFKMDAAGRRSEIDEYDSAGKLSGKSFYKYDDGGGISEIIEEESDSKTRSRCEFKYNDKGLASEEKCQYSALNQNITSHYSYEYDASGNWTKKTAKVSSRLPNGSSNGHARTQYREIKYYASKEGQSQQEEAGDRFDGTKLEPCPPMIIRKSGGVLQGSATKLVQPLYPREAIAARIGGPVVVEVTVDITGKVIAARALSGPEELREAAVEAARGWVFRPTMLSGVPVKVIGTLTFNFNL